MRVWFCRASALLLAWSFGLVLPGRALCDDPLALAVPDDYDAAKALRVDDHGDVLGSATRRGPEPIEQAILWTRRGGEFEAEFLPALDGLVRTQGRAFTLARTPVGVSWVAGGGVGSMRPTAWVRDWWSGEMLARELALPDGYTDASTYGANRFGIIVGDTWNPTETTNGIVAHHPVAWHWLHEKACDLGLPEGYISGMAQDVSELGTIVGTARRLLDDGRSRNELLVWGSPRRPHGGVLSCRESHDPCSYEAMVLPLEDTLTLQSPPAIGATGDVVGRVDSSLDGKTSIQAVLWKASRGDYLPEHREFLPVPPGFTDAYARDINSRGEILGAALVREGSAVKQSRPVLWRRGCRGWRIDVLDNPPGVDVVSPERLNDRGDVIAGTSGPNAQAWIWRR